jgi:hypothetical protein
MTRAASVQIEASGQASTARARPWPPRAASATPRLAASVG